jgi:hypothetical protein
MLKNIIRWFFTKRNPQPQPAPSRSILVTSNGLTWAMVAREIPITQMRDDLRALIIQAAPAWMLQAENYSPQAWIDGNAAEVA